MPKTNGKTLDRELGARLKARRLFLGLTQVRLGQKIGVTFQQIQKYEKGMSQLSATRLQQIANVLRVPTSYFLGEGKDQRADEVELLKLATIPDAIRMLRAVHSLSHSARTELIRLAESWAKLNNEAAHASTTALET